MNIGKLLLRKLNEEVKLAEYFNFIFEIQMQIEKFKKIVRVVHKASRSTLNFIKKDSAQQWFVFTIVLFTTLSSTSAFAQTSDLPTCIDPSYSYVNVKANKLNSGFNDQVLDNYDDSGNEIASLLGNMVFSIEPTLGCNYTAMLEEYPDLDGFARNGLNGTLENMNMAMLNNPPSTDVIAHLANEWVPGYEGVNTSVYAQDGFDVLQSINISDLWDKIRLLSYSFFVIALIAAGFMIMFRHKIGGQMAVTIFNTIPRIILGLILVTFSFAIVGIMIDFGAMLINVITGILGLTDPLVVGDPLSLVGLLFRGTDGIGISGFGGGGLLIGGIMSIVGIAFPPLAPVAAGGILLMFVTLVFIGITAYASLKVFITLMKAYIGIILDTVLAPIYLFVSVLPGKQSTATDWFYRILKNVLTFVLVFLIINLANYLFEIGVDYRFPKGLAGGDLTVSNGGGLLSGFLKFILPLFFFFTAAEAPNLIADLLPAPSGGKGTATAFGNVQKSFGKIPVVGSFFG
ncbi:hypothetical protein H6762_00375 [Candidatus Nomurabacteria bacterium]|uniref:Uncharacterized protein n=1 Tax=Candidatus Dojkabacteria bacterium TaxID=2099670 RepID=A0A955I0S9_9BACT|nr:hypothetical protein [Candidatus Dojkabacteria bacterium]MCB9789431.1 hypothetical protein [Candidatus Nomurabacteria bacterium]